MRWYLDGWNALDLDRILDAYATPSLGRDGALVGVRWTCRRPDGSIIWEFPDSYLLAAEGGRWWIVGDVVHE